jgi:ABC-type dipeptide/oligopeptide/nickel transport system permease subunit
LSLQGTVVGWGTDIGGSIRIPSHMNGLYGLKPSVSNAFLAMALISWAGGTKTDRAHVYPTKGCRYPRKARNMSLPSLGPCVVI